MVNSSDMDIWPDILAQILPLYLAPPPPQLQDRLAQIYQVCSLYTL